MRISDWSSDVCSSDLGGSAPPAEAPLVSSAMAEHSMSERIADLDEKKGEASQPGSERSIASQQERGKKQGRERIDRMSGGEGKRGDGRGDIGGGRSMKQTK